MNFDRICFAKIAWSESYQGGPIFGRHDYVQRYRDGSDRFNFLPGPDGCLYSYIPPVRRGQPIPKPAGDWLIILVSAPTYDDGRSFGRLVVVGWLEHASFVGSLDRPEYEVDENFDTDRDGQCYQYTVVSQQGRLLAPEDRNLHLPQEYGRKLGSASRVFVRGENVVNPPDWKKAYARSAEQFLEKFTDRSLDPIVEAETPGPDDHSTYEHKRRVEKAAERIAKRHFKKDWIITDVTKENLGYDFDLIHRSTGESLKLEVKGTASAAWNFFLSNNELNFGERNSQIFRIFLVTEALSVTPSWRLLRLNEVEAEFNLVPMTYRVTMKDTTDP